MKVHFSAFMFVLLCLNIKSLHAQTSVKAKPATANRLFIDVHYLPDVKFEDVATAHGRDLAVEKKHGVHFQKYLVDESRGLVYCFSSAPDSMSIIETHTEAHGLLPKEIYEVKEGIVALPKNTGTYFLDMHNLGVGNVKASDVADAHKKDLVVQKKYGVNFINYWVDEKKGIIFCLSEAKDSSNVIQTHKEAHGLLPDLIMPVKQGQ